MNSEIDERVVEGRFRGAGFPACRFFGLSWRMHNDLNLAMMRTRSYESELFIAFTHRKQALITGPEGEIVTNEENPKDRYVVSQIDLSAVDTRRSSSPGHLKDRRSDVY